MNGDNTNKKPIMKAIILVGGFGTRLRPLTLSKAKPLIEFCNLPILCHQIKALVEVGVDEIILAINYQPERMEGFIKQAEKDYNVKIVCSKEETPLGTAGPIGLAKDNYLKDKEFDYLFVFNADITCTYPLNVLLDFHRNHKSEGTLTVTKVKEPWKYGVIISNEKNQIERFVEKPKEFISDRINAGLYLFSKSFLNRVEAKPTSIEREVFPKMADEGCLYSMDLPSFWMDIGQPKDYLTGTFMFLDHLNSYKKNLLHEDKSKVISPVLIDEGKSVIIEEGALVGPNVVLGPGCVVKKGARIKNSVIMSDCVIGESSYIEGSIIGWKSTIGKWVRINGLTIISEDVNVKDEVSINKSIVLPNLVVKEDLKEDTTKIC